MAKRSYSEAFLKLDFTELNGKGPFPLRAWKRTFFVSFIDPRLKRAVKIEASAKKKQ